MNNNKFNTLNDREWLRLTGIKKSTFNKMLDILKVAEIEKFKKGGKTNKLSLENRLLMTLLYWREYQTYFHLGKKVLILVRLIVIVILSELKIF
ncbi:helix-turn-helix domain-containing protein [Spiroplasma poulsonii]|uniref:transposase family protein n=1 Tax=Spiroplasma poulsonii TaxID=2138 RepID=UPI001F54589F